MWKLGLAVVVCAAIGCGDDGGGGGGTPDAPKQIDAAIDGAMIDAPMGAGALTVSGTVAAGGPATGVTVVLWQVTSGSPDYTWKYGMGSSSGTMFMVTVDMTPPPQAINSYGIGVGIVGLLPAGTNIPDGMVTSSQLQNASFSDRYAIIYKAPTANPTLVPWIAPFGEGLSCGRCVDQATGFDTFEPIACPMVQIVHGAQMVCNWT
jgi:hypothetical protein